MQDAGLKLIPQTQPGQTASQGIGHSAEVTVKEEVCLADVCLAGDNNGSSTPVALASKAAPVNGTMAAVGLATSPMPAAPSSPSSLAATEPALTALSMSAAAPAPVDAIGPAPVDAAAAAPLPSLVAAAAPALAAGRQASWASRGLQSVGQCGRCGYLSSQPLCKACVLLEGLNRSRPGRQPSWQPDLISLGGAAPWSLSPSSQPSRPLSVAQQVAAPGAAPSPPAAGPQHSPLTPSPGVTPSPGLHPTAVALDVEAVQQAGGSQAAGIAREGQVWGARQRGVTIAYQP
ncbi:hypothetical protein V8C86DRAFT_2769660 [Haematococcus lacustris]